MSEDQAEHVISEQPEEPQGGPSAAQAAAAKGRLLVLGLAALGVVYGDIGTSPLYALRKCFHEGQVVAPSTENVLGVLSLIFWALIIVICVKYLVYVMRADNRGEGGILALLALLRPWRRTGKANRSLLLGIGVFGAALLYGDGMITPAISVLSAVEGLEVAAPGMGPFVVPGTVVILVLLFAVQRLGTGRVGAAFGPVMGLWFVTIAVLGLGGIVRSPRVLEAVNPLYGLNFFLNNRWLAFATLGGVFLVVTGGEALYADMGHFGKRPIRLAWFACVLPALLINYFGQGALILHDPSAVSQPFFLLAPRWGLLPLVVLATAATVIASQAVISAAFSLTRQAALMGLLPRLRISQTSSAMIGQVYVPVVNWLLMCATVMLVVGFGRSSRLAAAYGVAVSMTMVITTMLAAKLAKTHWKWGLVPVALVTVGLLAVDVPFLSANLLKLDAGAWVPLLAGGLVYVIMSTWKRGRMLMERKLESRLPALEDFLASLAKDPPVRTPGTAVFMTSHRRDTPVVLLHHLRHNQALHRQVLLVTVAFEDVPRVWPHDRLELQQLDQGFTRIVLHYGFMEHPNVPEALQMAGLKDLDLEKCTYYVGHVTVVPGGRSRRMALWRKQLFAFLSRVGADPMAFYHLPPDRVLEIGVRLEL